MALFPCNVGSGGTGFLDDGYYLPLGASTPISPVKITSGGSFTLTAVSPVVEGVVINCKNAAANKITSGGSTNAYVAGVKDNKCTYFGNQISAIDIQLSQYDYLIFIWSNGNKTFTFA